MQSLLEVVSNVVGVWPLTVVYLKETRRKTDGNNFVVYYIFYFYQLQLRSYAQCVVLVQKKGIGGYFYIDQIARTKFHLSHMILKIFKFSFLHIPQLSQVGTYTFG